MLKPEIVTLELPVLVSVTGRVVLPPTVSLPKFNVELDATSDFVDPKPDPLSPTDKTTVLLMFFKIRAPENVPEEVGAKLTVIYVVAPTPKYKGVRNGLILKPEPVMDATLTMILVVLVFFTASVCVFLVPSATVPNDTVDGDEVSALPCAEFASASDTPQTANRAASTEKCRWEGPPGRRLVKKACWKTLQKKSSRKNTRILDKFMPQPAYGPPSSRIY
jgi:hypothetical protein